MSISRLSWHVYTGIPTSGIQIIQYKCRDEPKAEAAHSSLGKVLYELQIVENQFLCSHQRHYLYLMDLVPFIYHEQQDGLLCLQHAINNLLQGSYFNAVDLAEIARGLDEKELASLLEGHESNADAVTAKFHSEGSQNYNDTGFFSVQVLSEALQIWHLDIQRIGSQENVQVKRNPQYFSLTLGYRLHSSAILKSIG